MSRVISSHMDLVYIETLYLDLARELKKAVKHEDGG